MDIQVLVLSDGDSPVWPQLRLLLSNNGCAVRHVESGADALVELETRSFSALVLEPPFPDLEASDVIKMAQQISLGLAIFLVDRGTGRVSGVELRSDSLTKHLQHILAQWGDRPDPAIRKAPVSRNAVALPGMIGSHDAMLAMYRAAALVARRSTTVLIYGESGTGKELVARAIHNLSPRSSGPMIVVNCAAIPDGLLESELFGHARGAFTGAVQSQLGKIHAANNGTLFLDEIGELPLAIQAKLLRFLQEREVQRLGSTDVFKVDVRVIAATNADLETLCAQGGFREDLYHRVNVFPIVLPALRNRRTDIPVLAEAFLATLAHENQETLRSLSPSAAKLLESLSWPGNVRELRNVVERAYILAESEEILEPIHFAFLNSEKNFRQNLPSVEPKLHLHGSDANRSSATSGSHTRSGPGRSG